MIIQKIKKILTDSSQEQAFPDATPLRDPSGLKTKEEIYTWIKEGILHFKEWYQPVDFGEGVVAYATVPPEWKPQPDSLQDTTVGLTKWNYIVKKHVPDLQGKRVLDLGCSSGLFSIEMARMGAREVIGVDRNTSIQHRSTNTPPPQDVVAQAEFVRKAFELLEGTSLPITYIAHDIGQLETLQLGHFDVVLALNIVYHELDSMPRLMSYLASTTDCLILQSSLGHGGELGRWASVPRQVEVLLQTGFTQIEIDAPSGYPLPMTIGKK
jgi:SAM-dependent methyltransferase